MAFEGGGRNSVVPPVEAGRSIASNGVNKKEKFMFKLYARNNSGSAAVEALLELLGVTYEIIDIPQPADGFAPAWYLAINPLGQVPSLALADDSVMTESAAIMLHLGDAFPGAGLAPAVGGSDRARYLRWMLFLASSVYMTDLRLYYPQRHSTDAAHAPAIKAKAIIDLNRNFDVLAEAIGEGPFILGSRISAVDLYAAMLLSWSEDVAGLFARQPRLATFYRAVSANIKVRAVWDRNGMP